MTDGAVYVGGRRELLRGSLDVPEMQEMSTLLHQVVKSFGKAGPPQTLTFGEGPAIFRLSVLLGTPFQIVVMGRLESPPDSRAAIPLLQFIQALAGFRHASLRPFDPDQFSMIVTEKTLSGGCRTAPHLPPLSQSLSRETLVPEKSTQGFPTGPEMTQVCEGARRFAVVFRPLIPGER